MTGIVLDIYIYGEWLPLDDLLLYQLYIYQYYLEIGYYNWFLTQRSPLHLYILPSCPG